MEKKKKKINGLELKTSITLSYVAIMDKYGNSFLLSTPMGVDYIVIGFDMEVQPLVTHNAA